ncbi:hypothetical protein ACFWG6_20125 [Streptomyces erythrochromogenes]
MRNYAFDTWTPVTAELSRQSLGLMVGPEIASVIFFVVGMIVTLADQ